MDWADVLTHAEFFARALQNSRADLVKSYLSENHQAEILKVLDSVGTIDKTQVLAVTPVGPAELPPESSGPEYMSMISVGGARENRATTDFLGRECYRQPAPRQERPGLRVKESRRRAFRWPLDSPRDYLSAGCGAPEIRKGPCGS
jgi:hypothetical protein